MGPDMMGGDMMGGGMMVLWLVVTVLIVVALTAGVVWLVRTLSGDQRQGHVAGALGELASRYARGEIDRDEYFRKREDLVR